VVSIWTVHADSGTLPGTCSPDRTMHTGKILFAQLMLPWTTFSRIVTRYRGNHRVRTLSCAEQ